MKKAILSLLFGLTGILVAATSASAKDSLLIAQRGPLAWGSPTAVLVQDIEDSTELGGSVAGRRYVRELDFEAQVIDFGSAFTQAKDLIARYGGEIIGQSGQNDPERLTLDVRVKIEDADDFLKELAQMAVSPVDKRGSRYRDVTLEIAELETRFSVKTQAYQDWQDILKKTKNAHEKHDARLALQGLAEDLAALEARLAYWNNELSHTYVHIVFSPKRASANMAANGSSFTQQLNGSIALGSKNAQAFLLAVAAYWPLCLAGIIGCLLYFFLSRNARRNSEQRVLRSIRQLEASMSMPKM